MNAEIIYPFGKAEKSFTHAISMMETLPDNVVSFTERHASRQRWNDFSRMIESDPRHAAGTILKEQITTALETSAARKPWEQLEVLRKIEEQAHTLIAQTPANLTYQCLNKQSAATFVTEICNHYRHQISEQPEVSLQRI